MPAAGLIAVPLRETEVIKVPFVAGLNTYTGSIRMLQIPYVSQRPHQFLCWAACGEMAFSNFGRAIRMCELASSRSGQDCCGGGSMRLGCDHVYWPHLAYNRTGMAYRALNGVLDAQSIRAELIEHERPVQLLLLFPRAWHTALVVGMAQDGEFLVHDPWFGERISCGYTLLLNGFGTGGSWRATYTELSA